MTKKQDVTGDPGELAAEAHYDFWHAKPATAMPDRAMIQQIRTEASIIAYLSVAIEALHSARSLAPRDSSLTKELAAEHHRVLELLIMVGKQSLA